MCFVSPFGNFLVSTNLYSGISRFSIDPSSFGLLGISFPFLSTNSVTGLTVGVYLAITGVPFLSTRFTPIPFVLPTNSGSGLNVTTPFLSIVYIPSPSTTRVVVPSSNVGGTSLSISTTFGSPLIFVLPPSNFGVPY